MTKTEQMFETTLIKNEQRRMNLLFIIEKDKDGQERRFNRREMIDQLTTFLDAPSRGDQRKADANASRLCVGGAFGDMFSRVALIRRAFYRELRELRDDSVRCQRLLKKHREHLAMTRG